ncbi:MAG TPA: hypothetical protein DCL49_03795, partial [Candidatus Omnitrophica bacterium]|nr:hypothetical protein [Candidatus Omnitrophota bacterium]
RPDFYIQLYLVKALAVLSEEKRAGMILALMLHEKAERYLIKRGLFDYKAHSIVSGESKLGIDTWKLLKEGLGIENDKMSLDDFIDLQRLLITKVGNKIGEKGELSNWQRIIDQASGRVGELKEEIKIIAREEFNKLFTPEDNKFFKKLGGSSSLANAMPGDVNSLVSEQNKGDEGNLFVDRISIAKKLERYLTRDGFKNTGYSFNVSVVEQGDIQIYMHKGEIYGGMVHIILKGAMGTETYSQGEIHLNRLTIYQQGNYLGTEIFKALASIPEIKKVSVRVTAMTTRELYERVYKNLLETDEQKILESEITNSGNREENPIILKILNEIADKYEKMADSEIHNSGIYVLPLSKEILLKTSLGKTFAKGGFIGNMRLIIPLSFVGKKAIMGATIILEAERTSGAVVGGRGEVAAASPLTIEKGLFLSQTSNNLSAHSALVGEVALELEGLFSSALYANERGFKPKISSSAINYSGPPEASSAISHQPRHNFFCKFLSFILHAGKKILPAVLLVNLLLPSIALFIPAAPRSFIDFSSVEAEEYSQDDIEKLIKQLDYLGYGTSAFAYKKLVAIGTPAVEPLIRALGNRTYRIRCGAARALGEIGDARAVEPLIKILGDGERYSAYAAEALGKIGDARAVNPLIKAVGYVRYNVHEKASEALKKLRVEPEDNRKIDKEVVRFNKKVIISTVVGVATIVAFAMLYSYLKYGGRELSREDKEEARKIAEEKKKRKADEETKRKAEEARRKAEEETKRKTEEEARRKSEEEAKRKADEETERKTKEESRKGKERKTTFTDAAEEERWFNFSGVMTTAKAYELFSLPENSSMNEVKKKRNKLISRYHPDIHTGKTIRGKYEVISKNINCAYEVIRDDHRRRQKEGTSGSPLESREVSGAVAAVTARASLVVGLIAGLIAAAGAFVPLAGMYVSVALVPFALYFIYQAAAILYAFIRQGGIRGAPLKKLPTQPIAQYDSQSKQINYHPAFSFLPKHIQYLVNIHEQAHSKGYGEARAYLAQALKLFRIFAPVAVAFLSTYLIPYLKPIAVFIAPGALFWSLPAYMLALLVVYGPIAVSTYIAKNAVQSFIKGEDPKFAYGIS